MVPGLINLWSLARDLRSALCGADERTRTSITFLQGRYAAFAPHQLVAQTCMILGIEPFKPGADGGSRTRVSSLPKREIAVIRRRREVLVRQGRDRAP